MQNKASTEAISGDECLYLFFLFRMRNAPNVNQMRDSILVTIILTKKDHFYCSYYEIHNNFFNKKMSINMYIIICAYFLYYTIPKKREIIEKFYVSQIWVTKYF